MKSINYIRIGVAALLILTSAATCRNSNTVTTVYKAEGIIITSVDVGMNTWRDYVVAGKATQTQIDAVHNAYDKYYQAQLVAKMAIEGYLATGSTNTMDISAANASVGQAEAVLLSLLNQYIIKK